MLYKSISIHIPINVTTWDIKEMWEQYNMAELKQQAANAELLEHTKKCFLLFKDQGVEVAWIPCQQTSSRQMQHQMNSKWTRTPTNSVVCSSIRNHVRANIP